MAMKNQKGFTLIEIIIVLAVVMALIGISSPYLTKLRPNMRLRSAAIDLHSNMQKMRIEAIKTNKTTAVIFDPANNKYTLCYDYDTATSTCTATQVDVNFNDFESGVGFGKGSAANAVGGGAIPASFVNYAAPVATSIFNNNGLGNSGAVYLDNENNDNTFAITQLASGLVKLYQWRGGTWQ